MSIHDAHYYTGAAAALTKLGVSNAWIQQKLLNAYRKGVTPERALRFENKMFDMQDRMLDAGAHLPDSSVPKDLWTIPKTEPRPLRPDAALNFYSRHYEAMGDKASQADNFLNQTLRHKYPVPSAAPETLIEARPSRILPSEAEPYRHMRGDLYHLRDSLGDVPEEVIESQYGSGGQHPRNQYVDKLNELDAKREKPFTAGNQRLRQHIARREEYARSQAKATRRSADTEAFREPPDETSHQPSKPGSSLSKHLLIGGTALGASAAGYGAYRHFNKDEQG